MTPAPFWYEVVGGDIEHPTLLQTAQPCEDDGRLHLLLPDVEPRRCPNGCTSADLDRDRLALELAATLVCPHQVQRVRRYGEPTTR